ncbi:MAG: SPOR domain-containing protein [Candidatus Acidiferrales bacterium]
MPGARTNLRRVQVRRARVSCVSVGSETSTKRWERRAGSAGSRLCGATHIPAKQRKCSGHVSSVADYNGREPIVRRVDLGTKGVYYRALVGPFTSAEAVTGACITLKAAGGNYIVQRI